MKRVKTAGSCCSLFTHHQENLEPLVIIRQRLGMWYLMVLYVNDFIVCPWSNGPSYTTLSEFALPKHQDWWWAPDFVVGVLSFEFHRLLYRRICPCAQSSIKGLDSEAWMCFHVLSLHICPCSSQPEMKACPVWLQVGKDLETGA